MIERAHDGTYDAGSKRIFHSEYPCLRGGRLNNIFFVSNDIKYIYSGRGGMVSFFFFFLLFFLHY